MYFENHISTYSFPDLKNDSHMEMFSIKNHEYSVAIVETRMRCKSLEMYEGVSKKNSKLNVFRYIVQLEIPMIFQRMV